jgi:hypothetical protein
MRFAILVKALVPLAVSCCLSLVTACGEDELGPAVMPVALCGMTPYELVPREQVGKLVSWEELPTFNIDPETINGLLPLYDLGKLAPVQNGCRTYSFRYTTQDRGQLVEATAILGIPDFVQQEGLEYPLVVFMHGTTGFSDPCAPSRGILGPFHAGIFAAEGFVTIAPDYIGMNGSGAPSTVTHGYLVAEQTAIGSWDAVRAGRELLALPELQERVKITDDLLIWGGSQGGHAALMTELYGPYYAPEFEPVAVLASLPPSSLRPLGALAFTDPGPTTISFAAFLTAQRAWYGMPEDLHSELTDVEPYNLATNAFNYVFPQDECSAGDVVPVEQLETLPLETFYQPEFIEKVMADKWEELPPWDCYLRVNTVATSPVKPRRHIPTFMVYSELDEMINTPLQEQDFDRLCDQGYQLDYLSCKNAGHADGGLWSLMEQIEWARARLAREPIPEDRLCRRRNADCCVITPDGRCDEAPAL